MKIEGNQYYCKIKIIFEIWGIHYYGALKIKKLTTKREEAIIMTIMLCSSLFPPISHFLHDEKLIK